MTPAAYNAACRQLGLTQARLARLLHVDVHTPSRWACGQARVPRAVALLLTGMQHGLITMEALEYLGVCIDPQPEKETA